MDGGEPELEDQKGNYEKEALDDIVPGRCCLNYAAYAIELRDAVQAAIAQSEIRQAVATLKTPAKGSRPGLWYPRVSVEGSAGVSSLRNRTGATSHCRRDAVADRRRVIVDRCCDSAATKTDTPPASRTEPPRPIESAPSRRSTSPGPTSTISSSSGVAIAEDMRLHERCGRPARRRSKGRSACRQAAAPKTAQSARATGDRAARTSRMRDHLRR